MLIGLGGGGLVNLWHHINFAWNVAAVELDPTMVTIATEYFGLDGQKLDIRIGDGLAIQCTEILKEADIVSDDATISFEAASLDFIVIDVDSKDTETGMSCPPAAFVEASYLQTLMSLLRHNTGVLAINVSARDPL